MDRSFCCRVHRLFSEGAVRIDSRTLIPLNRVSHSAVNKKQPFLAAFDEKVCAHYECDASMQHKSAATAMSRRFIHRKRIA
jgi:hypothetical protein